MMRILVPSSGAKAASADKYAVRRPLADQSVKAGGRAVSAEN